VANAPAAAHALSVLQLLSRHAAPVAAATIVRELGLPRSTVYHLLAVLRDHGFVAHLPEEQRYGLGVAAFELGAAYSRQGPLRWIARTVLAQLVADTTHNGHFAVLHGRDVLYVIEERAPGRPSLVTDVGVRLPAHLTASGLAMLAALPAGHLRALFPPRSPLVQRHASGPRTLTELGRALADARRTGHAREDGAITPGFSSVAAAVLDHGGYPVAAVAVTFPASEVGARDHTRLSEQVRAAALHVSARIHGRPRAADPSLRAGAPGAPRRRRPARRAPR